MIQMTGNARRNTLILLGVVVLITALIAASLPALKLQPGMPLPRLEHGGVVASTNNLAQPVFYVSAAKFFEVFFILFLVGSLLAALVRGWRGTPWKTVAGFLLRLLIIFLVAGASVFLLLQLPVTAGESSPEFAPSPTPLTLPTSPLGTAPPQVLWLVGIGLGLAAVLVAVWIFRASAPKAQPLDLVGAEAEKAWQSLKTGRALKDVIIQCYRQMSQALEEERGLTRKDFMTTGEFEKLLQAAGLPPAPVHQLTRLFEAARYGNWQPKPGDEQAALDCMEAIVAYSRAAARPG
jgi:hypothetical protein